jgi:RimJ/RimL family protein N-acetyltransferase
MTEVELGCDRANVRSAALAERLGFILRRIDRRAPTNPGETDERLVFSARPTAQDSS